MACQPQFNDPVKLLHWQIKFAPRAGASLLLSEILPLALVSLRSSIKEEMRTLPNELVLDLTDRTPSRIMYFNYDEHTK